ncbi:MAG: DUF1573 domain-containing protein [Cyclobacteriaceae bacterium]
MRIQFILIFLFAVGASFAQGIATFEKSSHDFGTIDEIDGAAEYSFEFTNTGTDSVKITYAKASCGCTTPSWTKEFVGPGEKGYLKARYNTRNRPGAFHKSISLRFSNGKSKTLYINGKVNPKPKTIEQKLPAELGSLRMKHKSFNMGQVTTEKAVTKEFDVYNSSDSNIVFLKEEFQVPEFVQLELNFDTLASKKQGKIKVTYDAVAKADWGYVTDRITLVTNDTKGQNKDLQVIAAIQEYFSEQSAEELEKAPSLMFDKSIHNFGKFTTGVSKETVFVLTNNGQSPLNIRAIKSNCPCIDIEYKNKDIKPGKSVEMKVTFDPTNRKGRQYKTVTVFTNDPAKPTQVISINGEI